MGEEQASREAAAADGAGVELTVRGMTCGGCVRSVSAAIETVAPGVPRRVDLATGRIWVADADRSAVRRAIEDAGFDVAEAV